MVYKMFLNTLSKMNDDELKSTLSKAKNLLSPKDYETLIEMIKKEKNI